jgi:hypothetical protein
MTTQYFYDASLLAYLVLPLQIDLTIFIYSGSPALRTSGFSSLKLKKKILEVIFSGVEDRVPPVSLDDGWSLLTSGLWDFDRCSDPMDQICTSPLRFLWSLGTDLTIIGYLGLVIQRPLSFFLLSLLMAEYESL